MYKKFFKKETTIRPIFGAYGRTVEWPQKVVGFLSGFALGTLHIFFLVFQLRLWKMVIYDMGSITMERCGINEAILKGPQYLGSSSGTASLFCSCPFTSHFSFFLPQKKILRQFRSEDPSQSLWCMWDRWHAKFFVQVSHLIPDEGDTLSPLYRWGDWAVSR